MRIQPFIKFRWVGAGVIGLGTLAGGAAADSMGLVGSELGIGLLFQSNATSDPFTQDFPRTVTVSDTEVEFANAQDLFDPTVPRPAGFGRIVETQIDAFNDAIEIDFDNAGSGRFTRALENTYVFTFESQAIVNFTAAQIDTSATTLGLVDESVRFAGDQLFINVQGLNYNSASFIRVALTAERLDPTLPTAPVDPGVSGGPVSPSAVPTPAALPAGLGLLMLAINRRRRAA